MEGLDYLGAAENLEQQVLVFRIRKIDPAKLRKAAGLGKWGAGIEPALAIVDQAPALALNLAAPVIQQQVANYGITADVSVADAVPVESKRPSQTKAAIVVGAVLGGVLALGGRWVYARLTGRRQVHV